MPTMTKRRKGKAPQPSFSWEPSPRATVVLLVAFILLFAVIRFRLRQMPLERDEGEYAYAGQLILQGVPPYQLAYNMKLPGTYAAYALIMAVLGQTPTGIHLGLLLLNAATTIFVYMLAKDLCGSLAGIVAAASYGLFSTSVSVIGLAAHATHFVVFAAVAGLVVLLRAVDRKLSWLYFVSGLLFGMAFVMKQPGLFFCLFGSIWVIHSEWARPLPMRNLFTRLGVLLAGMSVPYVLTCVILWRAGVFKKFWFWTVSYAGQYGTIKGFSEGAEQFLKSFPGIVEHSLLIWIIAAIGITALWWHAQARRSRLFVLGLLIFSFLAVCPGFYFRAHYFILILPAVAVLAGIAVHSAFYGLGERTNSGFIASLSAVAFLIAFSIALFSQHQVLFEMDPVAAAWFTYGAQPFAQALPIGDYIRNHSKPTDRVAVLGSEPEIYFYAHRHSATGYIYMYPLMEPQAYATRMQEEMISEIETARPEFLVMVRFPVSWLRVEDSNDHIFDWMKDYMQNGYDVVGVVHVTDDDGQTVYKWDDEAPSYHTSSPLAALVLRRHS
jgi:4-amino-4-deoxy-L-arabinose transferase-like glycosyltransferase